MGRACAWLLLQRGHRVLLIDPGLDGQHDPSSGSEAALGVLMAQVFHRNSGRAWRLRQRSLELWGQWRQQLQGQGWALPWRPGLLLRALPLPAPERARRRIPLRCRP